MRRIWFFIAALSLPVNIGAQEISLDACRKLAIDHNLKISMAQEQVDAAEALQKSASTMYLPDFSIKGAYTYLNKDIRLLEDDKFLPVVPYTAIDQLTGKLNPSALENPAVAASTFVINPSTGKVVTDAAGNPVFQKYSYLPASGFSLDLDNVFLINGGFTQPIYLGGKIKQANRIAGYTKELAEHKLSLTRDELIYSVDESYWRIVSLREKVKLAEKYREMLIRLVSDFENIRSEGIITDNDLMKAKLKLNESELQLLKATNGLELSKMVLCQMIGLQYSENVILTDSLNNAGSTGDPESKTSTANRPEIKMLEANVKIAESGVKLMLSRYLPDIMLSAGYSFMNPDPYRGFAEKFGSDYQIGIVCNVPIFHFGDRRQTLNAARSEHKAAIMKLEETRELLNLQIQQALYAWNESSKKSGYASLAMEQAEQNLKYTNDNFREGTVKTSDLLEAQVLWQKAWSELIDARTEQRMAESNLKKVTSTTNF